ncbi:TetR/AcrR family transcriptional regulator [Clostridium sp. JNZ J1-5]
MEVTKINREQQNKISKERILIASLKEFGEKDYSEASINNICKNNKISKGLLFHYYKSKDEIFLICVEKLFIDLSDYLKKNFSIIYSEVEENLKSYVEVRFKFFNEYPYYEQIFYTAVFNTPKHLAKEIKLLKKILDEINRCFLREIMMKVELKPNVIVEDVIEAIIDFANYLHVKIQCDNLQHTDQKSYIIEKHTQEFLSILNMLFHGICK